MHFKMVGLLRSSVIWIFLYLLSLSRNRISVVLPRCPPQFRILQQIRWSWNDRLQRMRSGGTYSLYRIDGILCQYHGLIIVWRKWSWVRQIVLLLIYFNFSPIIFIFLKSLLNRNGRLVCKDMRAPHTLSLKRFLLFLHTTWNMVDLL